MSDSTEIPKKKLFQIELSRDEIESAAIEAVTMNGLPLSVFEKTGTCKLLIPILDKLDITLNRASMKDRVLLQTRNIDPDFDDPLEDLLIQKDSEYSTDCHANSTPETMVKAIEAFQNRRHNQILSKPS